MADTTDIEKKNLEAHVELCAERYRYLEEKLETLENKIENTNSVIREVHDMVQEMSQKRNDQLINWGIAIIGSLAVIIGYLITQHVLQ